MAAFLSGACLIAGGIFLVIGAIGLLRFPDFFTRTHAVGVLDSLGAGLVLAGLMLAEGLTLVTVKLVLILLFMLITGPAATHALAKAALHGRLEPLTGPTEEGGSSKR